jgi:hypothetical protein
MKTLQIKEWIDDYKIVFFLLFVGLGWLAFWLLVILYSMIVL